MVAKASAVSSGWASRPGRTWAIQAGDGWMSGVPSASSSGARAGILLTTAIRSPWRRPGLMTAGLHTTRQPAGVLRIAKRPS